MLVKTGENHIEPLVTEGISTNLTDFDGTKPGEYVGHSLDTGYKNMTGTRSVESTTLTEASQAELARELAALPLRGDTVNGLFDGKIVDALVGDHKIDDTTGNVMIEVTSKETGDSKWANIRAFSPEVQARMEAEKATRNAKMVGRETLVSLDVQEPNAQTPLIAELLPLESDKAPETVKVKVDTLTGLEDQLAVANANLTMLGQNLSSKDRAALWQLSNAINYAERDSALKKMSAGLNIGNFLQDYKKAVDKVIALEAQRSTAK